MIDTTEAGAGSYPEPPNSKAKVYYFECEIATRCNISVQAENIDEATEYLRRKEYDDFDLLSHDYDEIIDIIDYEVEKL